MPNQGSSALLQDTADCLSINQQQKFFEAISKALKTGKFEENELPFEESVFFKQRPL
jgi:hypothetical protein